jgi:hypothetical protein
MPAIPLIFSYELTEFQELTEILFSYAQLAELSENLSFLATFCESMLSSGTPRALPVFAREDWGGLSSRPNGHPDPMATGDLP